MNARTSLVRPFFPADVVGQKTDKRVIHPRTTVIARSLWPRCNFRGRMVEREFAPHPSFRVIQVEAGTSNYDFERIRLEFFDIYDFWNSLNLSQFKT